ncbi:MAG: sulfite exporter TauE/SafE family protein [Alphaproteobacteria bacterium]
MGLEFGLFVVVGFFAQIVDGALGMAFGIIASTSLIAAGTPPAFASAAVHAAEIVTTGVSGASHVAHKNVDWPLFRRLVIPGVIGGIIGAYILTELPEEIVKPIVTVYLFLMAVLIFMRVLAKAHREWNAPIPLLGTAGGFLDAIGGGGWGPIVTSTLLASGDHPRHTIGTVNTAEFIITTSISITFLTQLDLAYYGQVVLGLIVGGALAAPLAGYVIKKLPVRVALVLVGSVLSVLTVVNFANLVA